MILSNSDRVIIDITNLLTNIKQRFQILKISSILRKRIRYLLLFTTISHDRCSTSMIGS